MCYALLFNAQPLGGTLLFFMEFSLSENTIGLPSLRERLHANSHGLETFAHSVKVFPLRFSNARRLVCGLHAIL